MDARTLAALKESIDHWERNVAAETPRQASTSPGDCALCGMFFMYVYCNGCPVVKASGDPHCRCTPYSSAKEALSLWHFSPDDPAARAAWRAAAQAELDFLRGLLPEGE